MKLSNEAQLEGARRILGSGGSLADRVRYIMEFLKAHRPDYYWAGLYLLHGDTLHLGPYTGPVTDHLQIPVGRGVCGTAVAEDANQIVGDVRELSNYLACNLETRSEIVVLIRDGGKILGQIDIDGTRVNAFDRREEEFLEKVATILAPLIPELSRELGLPPAPGH